MIDRRLLRLLGENRKYIFYAVALMTLGLIANISVTGCICYAIYLAAEYDSHSSAMTFLVLGIIALIGVVVRYIASRLVGDMKDTLGRNAKKDLRQKVYNKILRLGVRSTDGMSMAGLTQVSLEGVEQLDLYYSSYIPQFFLCHVGTCDFILRYCMDRLACGTGIACLCTADSRIYRGGIAVREKDFREVLGQVYLYG